MSTDTTPTTTTTKPDPWSVPAYCALCDRLATHTLSGSGDPPDQAVNTCTPHFDENMASIANPAVFVYPIVRVVI